jgi:hypothetical protein
MCITIPLSKVLKKVDVSRRTLCRLLKEGENVATAVISYRNTGNK